MPVGDPKRVFVQCEAAGSSVLVRGVSARAGLSAVGGERAESLERAEDRGGPWPVGGEVQCGSAGVAGDLSGDVQDAVAQPLGFGDGVLAVEEQLLCPDEDVVGYQRELEPRRVCLEGLEREMPGAAGLECLDAVLDFGVLAVQRLERGDIGVVLVCDEALEAVTIEVGEGEPRAGVWALAATDQPGALGPGVQVHQARELCDPCPIAWLAVLVDRRSPSVLADGKDPLAHGVVDRVAQRETDAALPAARRERVAGASRIRAGEDLTIQRTLR